MEHFEGCERLGTQTRAKGCTWQVYISQRKKTGALWILGWTHHLANPDPFSYDQHKAKKPGFALSIQRATMHRGIVSYTKFIKNALQRRPTRAISSGLL